MPELPWFAWGHAAGSYVAGYISGSVVTPARKAQLIQTDFNDQSFPMA